jgi:hypothetical protein
VGIELNGDYQALIRKRCHAGGVETQVRIAA